MKSHWTDFYIRRDSTGYMIYDEYGMPYRKFSTRTRARVAIAWFKQNSLAFLMSRSKL